ncbi:MAG: hypothetical protein OEM05_12560 [Myxococcales bacterium]|nr:hypothetical protein [Myxococcales bacterium]
MTHPFAWLSPPAQRRAFAVVAPLTVAVMVALDAIGRPLVTDASPLGIVSFEFAGDFATATRMLESWGEAGRVRAGLSLGLDYLFLVLYASAIALGCRLVARRLAPPGTVVHRAGTGLAWGQVGAATLDAVENFALIRLLMGSDAALWPSLAWWCAALKFALVIAGLTYVLLGLPFALARRRG